MAYYLGKDLWFKGKPALSDIDSYFQAEPRLPGEQTCCYTLLGRRQQQERSRDGCVRRCARVSDAQLAALFCQPVLGSPDRIPAEEETEEASQLRNFVKVRLTRSFKFEIR